MRKTIAVILGMALLLGAAAVYADQGGVVRFATLPPGPGHPEGLAADSRGNIYVATFEFNPPNAIHIFSPSGRLLDTISLPSAVPLGLAFDTSGNLYVANFGGGKVLKFSPPFIAGSLPVATYNVCTFVIFVDCGLNAMAFDAAGNLYVSDSFGGKVYKVALPGGTVSLFVADEMLKPAPPPHGFPPFGANGLAFSADGNTLFVANTADDRILKVNVTTKAVTPFAESINGADGILFDRQGRLWVAANQADEIVALDGDGRIVDRRGSFEGIGPDGAVKGLIFPASIVISRGSLFVTNAALALTGTDSEPEVDVTTFTISRIPLGGERD
ncbi:MAG TPA: NHL repeat-containing protein [Candidatus Binatia bacterium]|jgi:sugar lactone lactonase YvrE